MGYRKMKILLVILFMFQYACLTNSQNSIFFCDFENGIIKEFKIEKKREDSILIVKDNSTHNMVAKINLNYGDKVAKGYRCELGCKYHKKSKRKTSFQWDLKIDKNFIESNKNHHWTIFAQWHNQPDYAKGETWKTYNAGFPPVTLRYLNGKIFVVLNKNDKNYWRVGPKLKIEKGKWHHIKFNFKWSQKNDGYVEAFIDNKPLTPFNGKDYKMYGPNIYNQSGNYFKVGYYRHKDITFNNNIFLDNIKVINND